MAPFSFILPAYKSLYLRDAIDSILAQECTDFELIIVDDCSPNDLESIVHEYHDPRITYYKNQENIGGKDLVAQWNKCLSFAKGDYVILATDDDCYESDFLMTFAHLIQKYPDVNLFRARISQTDKEGHIKDVDACYEERISEIEFTYHIMHGMKGGIPQYVFKRKVLIERGGFISFPKAWASDDATAIMMADNGVINSQKHLVRFRWSDINISSDKSCGIEKVKARLMLGAWLKNIIAFQSNRFNTKQENDALEQFYLQQNLKTLPYYNKVTLISTMKRLDLSQWLSCARLIWDSSLLSFKDKLSILFRSI